MPEDLHIGVFVCECGHNIARTLDCEEDIERPATYEFAFNHSSGV